MRRVEGRIVAGFEVENIDGARGDAERVPDAPQPETVCEPHWPEQEQ